MPAGGNYFNGSVLRINDVSVQDRGAYYCIADNGLSPAARKLVNFAVEFPPKISVPRPRVAQAIGYDIELECKAEGFPVPQVSWFKDDKNLQNEDDYRYCDASNSHCISELAIFQHRILFFSFEYC